MGEHEVDRDSRTGKFVSDEYADQHPDTTEHEHVGGPQSESEQTVDRDSRTGRFVSEQDAGRDPEHTQHEEI
jgi:hypothetical protein